VATPQPRIQTMAQTSSHSSMLSPACVWLYSVTFKNNVWFVFNCHMSHAISCVVQKVKYCLDMCWTTNGKHNELSELLFAVVFLIIVCLTFLAVHSL